MNSNIRLSENISELRRKKNITQEELAEFMGVTKASVSKWERGSRLSAAGGTDVCRLWNGRRNLCASGEVYRYGVRTVKNRRYPAWRSGRYLRIYRS